MQISDLACPQAQDIILQVKKISSFSSFILSFSLFALSSYILLVKITSHPKGVKRDHKLPSFLPEPLHHVTMGSISTLDSKGDKQENTFPFLCPIEEMFPPLAGASQGSRPNKLCGELNEASTLGADIGCCSTLLPEVSGPADLATWRRQHSTLATHQHPLISLRFPSLLHRMVMGIK